MDKMGNKAMDRPVLLWCLWLTGMLALPLFADAGWIATLVLILMAAYFGQAWALLMAYVGQLSLGHALFAGVGAYCTALAIGEYGLSAWTGMLAGLVLSALLSAGMAWTGFRFSVRGIYFTLLTVACAEIGRLLFNGWYFVGGTGGYFLPALAADNQPLSSLRGDTLFFYYAFLVLCALAMALTYGLGRSRLGYLWRAIRDDEQAARAMGVPALKLKILAFVISACMTSVGGAFYALFNGSLFPDSIMGMHFSIHLIVAPIMGGLGHVFGAFLGAMFVVPMTEFCKQLAQQFAVYGLDTLVYGAGVLAVIVFLPRGLVSLRPSALLRVFLRPGRES